VLTNRTLIRLAYRFEKFIYRRSRLINVLTPAFRDVLIKEKKTPDKKIIYIPNAADLSVAENVSESFDREAFRDRMNWTGKTVFLYVGAHGVANHLVQVLEGAATINDSRVHFVLIGEGMTKPLLIQYSRDHRLHNVEFKNPVPKPAIFEYILGADVGMSVLKKAESFKTIYSNKTFDYMSCRKPVLMIIDGISRTLIEVAEAGLYAEPENPSEFKNKVMQYVENQNLIIKHGQNGYAYVKEHFDREKLALKYLEYVQKDI
jgi:glycosyltransferase involved in cell wall biosynthesis